MACSIGNSSFTKSIYINDYYGLALTYFIALSNLVVFVFECGNLLQSFNGEKLTANDQIDRRCMLLENVDSSGLSVLYRGYINVYGHYFQTPSLKPSDHDQLKQLYVEHCHGTLGTLGLIQDSMEIWYIK